MKYNEFGYLIGGNIRKYMVDARRMDAHDMALVVSDHRHRNRWWRFAYRN